MEKHGVSLVMTASAPPPILIKLSYLHKEVYRNPDYHSIVYLREEYSDKALYNTGPVHIGIETFALGDNNNIDPPVISLKIKKHLVGSE